MADYKAGPAALLTLPDTGRTTVDDKLFFETERLSYRCADALAAKIAAAVAQYVKDKTVVIVGTAVLAEFGKLDAAYAFLEQLRAEYAAIAGAAQAATAATAGSGERARDAGEAAIGARAAPGLQNALAAAASLAGVAATINPAAGAVLGLAGLLRQDVEYHGVRTVIDPLSFAIALAARVKEAGARAAFVPELSTIAAAAEQADTLAGRVRRLQDARLQAGEAVRGPVGGADSLAAPDLAPVFEALTAALERNDRLLADLQSRWTDADPESGSSRYARLLWAEGIRSLDATYLHGAVVSSGGHQRIRRNLLRTLLLGDGLSYAAGAVVRWAVLNARGDIAAGGLVDAREKSGTWFGGDGRRAVRE